MSLEAGVGDAKPERRPARRAMAKVRPWLRAFHRDVGYVAVGLTVIYAASGLAVNHIAQWDPSFERFSEVHELGALAGDDAQIAAAVMNALHVKEAPRDIFRAAPNRLDLTFEHRAIHVDPGSGHVVDEGEHPRVFLRVANWLHLNRGKKSWTWIADAYAAALLFLALSGLFMIPGKKGLIGRGGVFLALGAAIPIVYVIASGGP